MARIDAEHIFRRNRPKEVQSSRRVATHKRSNSSNQKGPDTPVAGVHHGVELDLRNHHLATGLPDSILYISMRTRGTI